MLAAVLMVENARVTQGRVIVVPQSNRSGFTHTDPMEAYLHRFEIATPAGPRWFRVGMRLTNPAMGRFRGRTGEELLVEGRDPNCVRAATLKRLFVSFNENGWPLKLRVARHLAAIEEVIGAYNELNPQTPIVVENIPAYSDVIARGLGAYLRPPPRS